MSPKVLTLSIPGEINAHNAEFIAASARAGGFEAKSFRSVGPALTEAAKVSGARVVICGSLYLGGYVLDKNGATESPEPRDNAIGEDLFDRTDRAQIRAQALRESR